ncbi:MAG: hypothetical protein QOF90_3800 [Acetobacteraceae bacterium]|jgi:hypothetical protein|nr:hypothetical protein [Acetobacteraceae bacterium]
MSIWCGDTGQLRSGDLERLKVEQICAPPPAVSVRTGARADGSMSNLHYAGMSHAGQPHR